MAAAAPAAAARPSLWRAALGFLAMLALGVAVFALIIAAMPPMDAEDRAALQVPVSLEQAKALGLVLGKYRDDYFSWVVALWAFAYLFMQTFVIPLTLPLCLLAGYLFPPSHMALLMVCTASATGAAGAYGLSYFLGRDLVRYYVPDKLALWEGRVKKHSDNLLFYTIFLRATPFLPNWFINIASPVLGVPLGMFWIGTFLGVAPPCFLYVESGRMLQELTTTKDIVPLTSVLKIAVIGSLALLPVLFKDRLKKKLD